MLVIDPVYTNLSDSFVELYKITATAPLGWWYELRNFLSRNIFDDQTVWNSVREAALRNNGKLVVSDFNDEPHDTSFHMQLDAINHFIEDFVKNDDNIDVAAIASLMSKWFNKSFMLKTGLYIPVAKDFWIDACNNSKYLDEWDILLDFISRLPKQH